MRSLTLSSAGPLIPPPYTTPFIPHIPDNVQIHHPYSATRHTDTTITHNMPHHPSFFNVHSDSLLLSAHARDRVTRAISHGWANSTVNRYSGTIKQFLRFCDKERVPEHLRFPADEFVLCAFLASSLGKHAGSTPRARLSALKAWHTTHNVEWKGSARLRYVLNGVCNSAPGSSTRPPRPPINARMMIQLIEGLNLELPLDAAVAACAVTAFWGQCRLGELLPLSTTAPTTSLPTRSAFKRSVKNPHSCLLHLPTTKTHRHGQDVVLVDQLFPINPIVLLKNHIRVNNLPNDIHIFTYLSDTGLISLTKSIFLQRCNVIWSRLGYPRTTGHSFRIGGTTELLIAGIPPDVVKATGRWSSESFLRYWRSLDILAPQYIRNIHTYKHKHRRRQR